MTVYSKPSSRRELIAKLSKDKGIPEFVRSVVNGWDKDDPKTVLTNYEQTQQGNKIRTDSKKDS